MLCKTQKWLDDALAAETDACTIWPFRVGEHGYGEFRRAGRKHHLAHRYVCARAHGAPPAPKLDAAHRCGTKLCCNKRHLRWATRRENHADKKGHGRHVFGERITTSKLTERDVVEIRASGARGVDLAKQYQVSQSNIHAIRSRRSWSHVA